MKSLMMSQIFKSNELKLLILVKICKQAVRAREGMSDKLIMR